MRVVAGAGPAGTPGGRGSRKAPVEAVAAGPPLPPGRTPCGGAPPTPSGDSAGVACSRSWTATRTAAWTCTSCAKGWPGWEGAIPTVHSRYHGQRPPLQGPPEPEPMPLNAAAAAAPRYLLAGWTHHLCHLPSPCPHASGLTTPRDKTVKAPGLQCLRLPGPSDTPPPQGCGVSAGEWTVEPGGFPVHCTETHPPLLSARSEG